MEEDTGYNNNSSGSFNGRNFALTEADKIGLTIDGLKVVIEGVKALSIMKLIFQIQVTTNEIEREKLEQTLQMMVATLY